MNDALYIGATGMQAQQLNVAAIANNLANVNTAGFKKNRVSFEDVFYRSITPATTGDPTDPAMPVIGLGTLVSSNAKSFLPGEIKQTDGPLDVAIRGNGFFEVQMPDGSSAYTRVGSLSITSDGMLGTTSGFPLKQQIEIPQDAQQIVIDSTGKVSAKLPNENNLVALGQIELSSVPNPEGLNPLGDNLYAITPAAGQVRVANPAEEGMGTLAQGYMEASNVNMAEEMVNLVLAQRAYELNAKVIQASDEMLAISNNLRR